MFGDWLKGMRKYAAGTCLALAVCGGNGRADENDTDLRKVVEQQSKQIEELRKRLDTAETSKITVAGATESAASEESVKRIVADYLKEADDKKKPEQAAAAKKDEGHVVGSSLGMTARWDPANGVRFETASKDFTLHVGYRFQLDTVFFTQSDNIRQPSPAGIGDLQDGAFFRRNRPSFDGTMWEVVEFNVELALEQVQSGVPNFDEAWVGLTKLPILGSVRVGHLKVPQGLEGDMVSSSKAMTFMERAAYTDAFYENFATGIWAGNSVLDQHATWSAMAYRQDNPRSNSAADFGDGEYGYSGRLTGLLIDENEGRHLAHVGASGTWRNNLRPDPGLADPRVTRFRARPEMRDAIGDFGSGSLPGDSARLVDTGIFASTSTGIIGTEALYILGPFSVQAEYAWAFANEAVVNKVNQGTLGFGGGYIQLSYFLTGENRTYDRRLGRLGSTYIAKPFTSFWAVNHEDGGLSWGPGAWEVAARFSRVNLNDGAIQGGGEDGLTLGVNWYLNTNVKVQFEYLHNNRYDLKTGVVPGNVDAFGIRTQMFF